MQGIQKIVFSDVGLRALQQKKRLLSGLSSIINRGQFLQGIENDKLQVSLHSYLRVSYIHLVGSGHDALLLSLLALGLTKADEIVVPANAYPTAFPAYLSGAKLVLCDVDTNGQMSLDTLEKVITEKTKAIILVHMFGLMGNVERIITYAKEKKIILIEDCAQAYDSRFNDIPVGTKSDIGCFSFYPTKNLGTLGDGGAIATDNKNYSDRIRMFKSYGEKVKYDSRIVSGHSRLPEIQAGVLNIYLESQHIHSIKRKQLFFYYVQQIKKMGVPIRPLLSHPASDPVPHLFVVEVKKRKELQSYLTKQGIEVHRHYPHPVHLVPAFQKLGYKQGDFPQAERLSENCLSLPFHSYLTKKQIHFVVSKLLRFYD